MQLIRSVETEIDFDNPIGVLSDCHGRIMAYLDQMLQVVRFGRGGAMNQAQRSVLESALRYFRESAALNTEDEEDSLFPLVRLRAEDGDARARQSLPIMEHLVADHDVAAERHKEIDGIGSRWLNENELCERDLEILANELTALRAFYAAHMADEDKQLFVLANEVLPAECVEMLGRQMAARRGLSFDALPASSPGHARCSEPSEPTFALRPGEELELR